MNKLEDGTRWRMCQMTLARRHARDRASQSSLITKVSKTSEVAQLALVEPLQHLLEGGRVDTHVALEGVIEGSHGEE
jgi:hypothetical protein